MCQNYRIERQTEVCCVKAMQGREEMRPSEVDIRPGSRIWIPIVCALLVYGVLNFVSVFALSVPGLGVFFGWGLGLPLLFLGGSWVLLARARRRIRLWWLLGIGLSLAYLARGMLPLACVGTMWAAG